MLPGTPVLNDRGLGEPGGSPGAVEVYATHLSRDGRPWLPVTGEFHFSRYEASDWERELRTMRAAGLTGVATYVLWLLHEPEQGRWDWSGNRDLRRFVTLAREVGLDVIVRLGPWAHGEARNGGFPDWLLETDCEPRTDDPRYLSLVRPLYAQVARQLRGLLRSDGGPIVGLQVDNELYDNPRHLRTLRRLAEEAGLSAPLWTVTAWGHAHVPEDNFLPLYSGYSDTAWDEADIGWPPTPRVHYFYSAVRDDSSVGADLRPAGSVTEYPGADPAAYPFAMCELGGGMHTAYHRRPLVEPEDVAAMALTKLGSGSVWQGYYLYHGSEQQVAAGVTTQESHATGYPNDCPTVDYDYQAPLGSHGQVRRHLHLLRRQHLMIADMADVLPLMPLSLPEQLPTGTDDLDTVRWAVRTDGTRGLLFVTNHQPWEQLPLREGVRFTIALPGGDLSLPTRPCRIEPGAFFAWPFGLDVGSVRLAGASCELLFRAVLDGVPTAVLSASPGLEPELLFDAATLDAATVETAAVSTPPGVPEPLLDVLLSTLRVHGLQPGTSCLLGLRAADGSRARVLLLTAEQADRAWRLPFRGVDSLVLCAAATVAADDGLEIRFSGDATSVGVYPPPIDAALGVSATFQQSVAHRQDGVFAVVDIEAAAAGAPAAPVINVLRRVATAPPRRRGGSLNRPSAPVDSDFESARHLRVSVPVTVLDGTVDVLLRILWVGDVGRAYDGARLISDQFWQGRPWDVPLRRLAVGSPATAGPLPSTVRVAPLAVDLRLLAWAADSPVMVSPQVRPSAVGETLEITGIELVPIRAVLVS